MTPTAPDVEGRHRHQRGTLGSHAERVAATADPESRFGPGIDGVAVPELIDEYLEVLRRPKFQIDDGERRDWIDLILDETMHDPLEVPSVLFPRDTNDAKVLAAALAWNADYLVTGDRDFADAPDLGATRIVTPREFADVLGVD